MSTVTIIGVSGEQVVIDTKNFGGVSVGGTAIDIGPKHRKTIVALAKRCGETVEHHEICIAVFGSDTANNRTYLRKIISELRDKIPVQIRPIPRVGYTLSGVAESTIRAGSSESFRVPCPSPTTDGPRLGRSEELGVIERFLAQRGSTRCPGTGTAEHIGLPMLEWDKTKRKWVRPIAPRQAAE